MRTDVRGWLVVGGVAFRQAVFPRCGDSRSSVSRVGVHSCADCASRPKDSLGRKVVALLLLCVGLLASACDEGTSSYRYKLTVEVDTPQGVRSGSSVIEVRSHKDVAGNLHSQASGEAVAVELPDGRTIFALLRSPSFEDAAFGYAEIAYAARLPNPHRSDWLTRNRALRELRGAALLPRQAYPMIVRFRDVRDPRTAEILDPSQLGQGTHVRRIAVEITSEPVTRSIEGTLPSFGPGSGYDQWLASLDFHDPRRLFLTDFVRE